MEQMYNVSSNPHIRDKMTTSRIMQLVVIALLPTTLFGIWNFGVHALLVVLATVASSVFFEWLYDRLMHKKNTTTDFSAVVTSACTQYAASDPAVDACTWQCFCDHCCKTAVRWTWTELYEPGSCRKMFPYDLFCRKND